MNRSEKLGAWAQAMIQVQQQMPVLSNTREVHAGSHTYSYAEWDKLVPIALPILNANGFAVIQAPRDEPGRVVVETVLLHISDEWCSGECGGTLKPNATMQDYGSALSYAKRYGLLSMIVAVVGGEDDDAARASASRSSNQSNGWNREDRARKMATDEIASCMTVEALHEWWQENKDGINDLSPDVVAEITGMVSFRHKVLTGALAAPQKPASVPPALPKAPAAPRAPAPIAPPAVVPPASVPKAPVQPAAPQQPKAPLTLAKGTAPAAPAGPIDDFAGFGDNFPE